MIRTVHGVLERNARKYPNNEALITSTSRLTYAQLNHAANQLAKQLQSTGLDRGARVAMLAGNNENFIISFYALMKMGAIPMPISMRLTANEIQVLLRNTNANGIVYEAAAKPLVDSLDASLAIEHVYNIEQSITESARFSADNLNLDIDSHEVCEILFTSGTTGTPKGVLFNHERILAISSAIAYEFQLNSKDKMLTLMPLTHSAPLNTFFLSGMYAGTAHVVGNFTPKDFLRWVDQEKTTFMFAAPVAYLLTAKETDLASYDLSSMRVFAYGGGPLALAAYERVKEAFQNENFYQVYGLTEAGPNGILLTPEEHLTKAGSVGKMPTINMEFRIVRADGSDTDPHEYGEIIMRGDSMMLEYDNNPVETSLAIQDGWLYTGDIAYKDDDGYMYIVDRKKDIIISGGVNIYPRDVEEALAKHPAVLESCVIGVPHEEWGETVKAVVVLKGEVTEEELRAFVSEYLADYKRPRQYMFVKELPRNASGKILKQQVKQM